MNYHDVLARLGVTNAHPGGKQITELWLQSVTIPAGASVLDVGCGNGATACLAAKRWHADVTALDLRKRMVENTKRRAVREGVRLKAIQGSAESLPFRDGTFDFLICESVLVFVRPEQALHEFQRVLKPGGQVVDVEMMTLGPVTQEWRNRVKSVYGATHVPDLNGWRSYFHQAGFGVRVIRSGPIASLSMSGNQQDPVVADLNAFSDPQVLQIVETNGRWLQENQHTLGYGIFLLTKSNSET
ncbi:class I SAM-dependent methyltransferase [Alicyclobacillus dauci]|uniref:Class I SAM-dependent methyltransferase n=1 Tax=Alicyclobacillus dauci TaxID=1475485 RepID=A0ABY6YWS7_9BACL|nr:class I SAM-dependent methyltransferase [Alicyclobacillus dauci]WAH34995.1 class I SAM-dependent methyltransferase [Alicyclobacillus dauci]